jgi:methylase of polypeptide subunit release factors
MATATFKQKIHDLNFSFLSKDGDTGVLLANALDTNVDSPAILFATETAIKFGADAIYFRYFEDGRGVVPQLYFFDYTNKALSSEDRNQIHIRMWNGYQVPAYVIIEKHSVSIFDARERPSENKDNYATEIITLSGDAIKAFKAKDFNDGLFWQEYGDRFNFEQSAARDLIRGLKEVYSSFQEKSNLDRHVALKLLVQSLLIKYLEERDEDSASGYFAGTYFKRNFQCDNFCDTIRNGKLLDLLDQLAKDFNGKIFEWNKETEKEERAAIRRTEINLLADYLDGNNQNSQYVIWRLYSFSHLPIEILSSVYEELLTNSKDIVYTPEMIVSTLVDECMPLKAPQPDYKLIDVSCGSGIFLVKAYKRIVQWWRYEQWLETGLLPKPSLAILKELLLNSIYGIDIQQDAIRLSVFSLALAILDEVNLDPPTWGKLRFPDLSENIITADFFGYTTKKTLQKFDLVIGNPPFNPPLNEADEKQSNGDYLAVVKNNYGYTSDIKIPSQNIALHFLVQSLKLVTPNGILCLVQPSGPLLYQNEIEFKHQLFSKNNLLQIIDFTKLADTLWGKRNVATCAIFLRKSPPDNSEVLHLVASRTFSNANRLFLEFDSYDFHLITKDAVINDSNIWKINLLGGGRINQLIKRIESFSTLGEFLKKKKKDGWVFGVGFKVTGEKNKANYITGRNFIPEEGLNENGIDLSKVDICNIEHFDRPRKVEIYSPPHILIREIIGANKIPIAFVPEYLAFPIGILGIHAPIEQSDELLNLFNFLENNNEFLRFYITATSSRMMVSKATSITKEDIMRIPYASDNSKIFFSDSEQIVINDILNVKENEYSIFASNIQLSAFSTVFCKTLNSVYQTEERSFQLLKILDAGKYHILHFEYTDEIIKVAHENAPDVNSYLETIIPERENTLQKSHVQKVMKVYGQDCIILAKPKQYRYWRQSIALRDADESFADYVKSRYNA